MRQNLVVWPPRQLVKLHRALLRTSQHLHFASLKCCWFPCATIKHSQSRWMTHRIVRCPSTLFSPKGVKTRAFDLESSETLKNAMVKSGNWYLYFVSKSPDLENMVSLGIGGSGGYIVREPSGPCWSLAHAYLTNSTLVQYGVLCICGCFFLYLCIFAPL